MFFVIGKNHMSAVSLFLSMHDCDMADTCREKVVLNEAVLPMRTKNKPGKNQCRAGQTQGNFFFWVKIDA